jgi:hypothetical protein
MPRLQELVMPVAVLNIVTLCCLEIKTFVVVRFFLRPEIKIQLFMTKNLRFPMATTIQNVRN